MPLNQCKPCPSSLLYPACAFPSLLYPGHSCQTGLLRAGVRFCLTILVCICTNECMRGCLSIPYRTCTSMEGGFHSPKWKKKRHFWDNLGITPCVPFPIMQDCFKIFFMHFKPLSNMKTCNKIKKYTYIVILIVTTLYFLCQNESAWHSKRNRVGPAVWTTIPMRKVGMLWKWCSVVWRSGTTPLFLPSDIQMRAGGKKIDIHDVKWNKKGSACGHDELRIRVIKGVMMTQHLSFFKCSLQMQYALLWVCSCANESWWHSTFAWCSFTTKRKLIRELIWLSFLKFFFCQCETTQVVFKSFKFLSASPPYMQE